MVLPMNTMKVEDYVVLGRTVPEDSKRYGKKICMAGFSPENSQFLRVYPLLVPVGENTEANGFRARHVYSLDLRRNPLDNRTESWRVADETHPTSTGWSQASELSKKKIVDWLTRRAVNSISSLNECRLSIGAIIVRAKHWEGTFVQRSTPQADESDRELFENLEVQTDIDFQAIQFVPYIRFGDSAGDHRLQIREWGAYVLLSNPKYAGQPDQLWSAPGYRADRDLVLVIGNMNNHRANWLVIKTFELDQQEADDGLFAGLESS